MTAVWRQQLGRVAVMTALAAAYSAAAARPPTFLVPRRPFLIGSPPQGNGTAHLARIPRLPWQARSDWINVRTDVTPGAAGDGKADDTAAIQQALDRLARSMREGGPAGREGSAVFLPPGTYRITQTLTLTGPIVGALLVGCGRDTRLVWDGEAAGKMLHLNGVSYSSFVGLELDGRGRAAAGFWYRSDKRFQTEVTHRHLAFRGFTDAGVLEDPTRAQALAETAFENCLFEECRRGVAFPQFNDYDYTFDGCEFRGCDTAIECVHGNFYVRNCHFEGNRNVDILDASEHGSSVRRCTSLGSRRFIERRSTVAPLTVQDCRVEGWTNPSGAILLSPPPALLFDCVFTHLPRDGSGDGIPPVRVADAGQRLLLSGNRVEGAPGLLQPATHPKLYEIPRGRLRGGLPAESFLRDAVRIPGRVLDAKRDYGARGDGVTDDTPAIQKAVDAAARASNAAIAYLPAGTYAISKVLQITGRGFYVGGSGWATRLVWKGAAAGAMVEVRDPQDVTLENLAIGNDNGETNNGVDILQSGSGRPSRMTYDGVYVYGMYQKQPFRKGLRFENLGKEDVVLMPHVQGNLHFVDCARATVLANCSYEGSVVIEGKARPRDGLLGFQTRLATIVTYGLYLRDSQNVVMSDFYVEQSDSGYRFEGARGDPAGRATIQGAKVEFTVPAGDPAKNTTFDIRGYHGAIFFGPDQFYTEPKLKRIRQQGGVPVELFLVGCSWYDSKLEVEMGPAARLFTVGNDTFGMQSVRYDAADALPERGLRALLPALDDLRRLGELDLRLNHPDPARRPVRTQLPDDSGDCRDRESATAPAPSYQRTPGTAAGVSVSLNPAVA
jgi:hypothetical protein